MKQRNKIKRLKSRQEAYEKSIELIRRSGGSITGYHKPGSIKKSGR